MGKRRFHDVAAVLLLLWCSSCEGLFSGIYDEPVPDTRSEYGFVRTDGNGGTIYLDSRSYARWTYLDLKRKTMDTSNILSGETEPSAWDFALHRYDVKTHGGAVYETAYTDLGALGGIPSQAVFTPDSPSRVITDMSGMMEGDIHYDSSDVNPVLSSWLDVNTSVMPPVYTLSRKVYLLRLSDGSHAALLFSDFTNLAGEKGFITIQYIYPL